MKIDYNICKSTLKEVSKDTSSHELTGEDNYMTDSEIEVINFDEFMEYYFKTFDNCQKKPASIDALCKVGDKWCFIEFKNGKIKPTQKRQISEKIGHSILVLLRNEEMTVQEFNDKSVFILVYNRDQNIVKDEEINVIKERLFYKAKESLIKFSMDRFQTIYFKEVFTFDKVEFDDYLRKTAIHI